MKNKHVLKILPFLTAAVVMFLLIACGGPEKNKPDEMLTLTISTQAFVSSGMSDSPPDCSSCVSIYSIVDAGVQIDTTSDIYSDALYDNSYSLVYSVSHSNEIDITVPLNIPVKVVQFTFYGDVNAGNYKDIARGSGLELTGVVSTKTYTFTAKDADSVVRLGVEKIVFSRPQYVNQ